MEDKIGHETLLIMKTVDWYNNWLFSFVKPHIKNKILEVGAGIGNFTNYLIGLGSVYSIDISKQYIRKLKASYKNKAKVGFGDIEKAKYFFPATKFDSLVIMNVLEHIKNDSRALKNMYSLLAPKGKLIILVPAFSAAYGQIDVNLGHFRRYTINSLTEKLKTAGFNIVDSRYLNSVGILGWFVNARLFKREIIPLFQLTIFNIISRPFLSLERFFKIPFGLSVLIIAEK